MGEKNIRAHPCHPWLIKNSLRNNLDNSRLNKNGGQKPGPHFMRLVIRGNGCTAAYSSFFAFGFLPSLFANCGSLATYFSGSLLNASGQCSQQKYTFLPL